MDATLAASTAQAATVAFAETPSALPAVLPAGDPPLPAVQASVGALALVKRVMQGDGKRGKVVYVTKVRQTKRLPRTRQLYVHIVPQPLHGLQCSARCIPLQPAIRGSALASAGQ